MYFDRLFTVPLQHCLSNLKRKWKEREGKEMPAWARISRLHTTYYAKGPILQLNPVNKTRPAYVELINVP